MHMLFASFLDTPSAMSCFTKVLRLISSILLCCLSVRSPRYPYLFTAGIADAVFSPLAFSKFAVGTHRHCSHFRSAGRAVIGDISRIGALPTSVSCKRRPHPAMAALWGVALIHDPSCHCQTLHPSLPRTQSSILFSACSLDHRNHPAALFYIRNTASPGLGLGLPAGCRLAPQTIPILRGAPAKRSSPLCVHPPTVGTHPAAL